MYQLTYIRSLRKCLNSNETPPWKLAILAELKSGLSAIVQHLQNSSSVSKSTEKSPESSVSKSTENPLEHAKRQLDFEENTKLCSIQLTDVRKHPWWGPKVRQLSGEKTVIVPKILKRISPLDTISKNIQANVYENVWAFHLELKKVAKQLELMPNYAEIMNKTFPWFDLSNPLAHFEELSITGDLRKAPSGDHFYASRVLKKSNRREGKCPYQPQKDQKG